MLPAVVQYLQGAGSSNLAAFPPLFDQGAGQTLPPTGAQIASQELTSSHCEPRGVTPPGGGVCCCCMRSHAAQDGTGVVLVLSWGGVQTDQTV